MNEYNPNSLELFWYTKEDNGYLICDPIVIPELVPVDISKAKSVLYTDLGKTIKFECKLVGYEISFSLRKETESCNIMMGVAKPKEVCNE